MVVPETGLVRLVPTADTRHGELEIVDDVVQNIARNGGKVVETPGDLAPESAHLGADAGELGPRERRDAPSKGLRGAVGAPIEPDPETPEIVDIELHAIEVIAE